MPNPPQEVQTIDVGEAQVQAEEGRLFGKQQKGSLAIRCLEHLVTLRAKPHAQQLADGGLVIDDEDFHQSRTHAATLCWFVGLGTGRVIVNTAPERSVRFAAVMVPCRASMNPREIARPSPVPARTWSPLRAR